MHRVDLGLAFEQLQADVAHGADARRAVAPFVRGNAGRRQKLLRIGAGRADRGRQHQGRDADQADGSQILERIVGELRVEQLGNRHVAIDHQTDGMVIGGLGHVVGRDIAASAHLVFHNDGLAERLGQWLRQGTRGQVGRRARWKTDDDAHGLGWPGRWRLGWRFLRERQARERGEGKDQSGPSQHGAVHKKTP